MYQRDNCIKSDIYSDVILLVLHYSVIKGASPKP